MKKFNEETPDAPGVQYFSWGAEFEPGLLDPFRYVLCTVAVHYPYRSSPDFLTRSFSQRKVLMTVWSRYRPLDVSERQRPFDLF